MKKLLHVLLSMFMLVGISFSQDLIREGFEENDATGVITTSSNDVMSEVDVSTTNGTWKVFKCFRTTAGSPTGSLWKLRMLKSNTGTSGSSYIVTPEISSVGTISGYSGRGRALNLYYSTDNGSSWNLVGSNTAGNVGSFSAVVNYSGNAIVKVEDPTTSDDDFDDLVVTSAATSVEVSPSNIPTELSLKNYPNPFNPNTKVVFSVKTTGKATLKVYDMRGRTIATLFNGVAKAGEIYQVPFGFELASSGIYYARLESVDGVRTQKMVYMK